MFDDTVPPPPHTCGDELARGGAEGDGGDVVGVAVEDRAARCLPQVTLRQGRCSE